MVRAVSGAVLALLLLAVTQAGANPRVSIAAEHWPPWLIAKGSLDDPVTDGIAVRLLQELFKRLSVTPRFDTIPWQRALVQVESGAVDLIPLISRTDQREKHMVFSDPLYVDQLILVTTGDAQAASRCDASLKGAKVGTVRDYVYGPRWDAFRDSHALQPVPANDDLINLRKVAQGRLDYTVQYYSFLRSSMDAGEVTRERLHICPHSIERIPLRIGISRQSALAARVGALNEALGSMRADGSYRRILGDLYPHGHGRLSEAAQR